MHTLVQLVVERRDVEALGVRSIIQACTLPRCSAIWQGSTAESSVGLLYWMSVRGMQDCCVSCYILLQSNHHLQGVLWAVWLLNSSEV